MAADSSTGDARWMGSCKATRFKVRLHGFVANLSCSQTDGANGHVEKFEVVASGGLEAADRYTVRIDVKGGRHEVNAYQRMAAGCTLDPKLTAIGPDASVAQPLNPDLQFLAGFPKEASTNLP